MKKIILVSTIILLATSMQAQTISVGKKFQVIAAVKTNTTVTQMGNEMEIPTTGNITTDYEIKSLLGKTITVSSTLKRIIGSATVMGNETKIDSNDSTTANNPQMADAMKDLNKPLDIIVEVGKPYLFKDMSSVQSSEDVTTYLFSPVEVATTKEGFAWSDSASSTEGSKITNNYTVTKITKDEIIISVNSNSTLITTKQQMGMDMKVTMQGTSTSNRIYDATNGLLKNATITFTATGNTEVQSMTIPMTTKGTGTVTTK